MSGPPLSRCGDATLAVRLGVPDVLDRRGVQVAEDRAAVEVGAAERDPAVPQHRERQPRPVARVVDVRFLCSASRPSCAGR